MVFNRWLLRYSVQREKIVKKKFNTECYNTTIVRNTLVNRFIDTLLLDLPDTASLGFVAFAGTC
jgi:hypothetical protein